MPKSKRRKNAKKYQKPTTREEALERKLKPRMFVMYESFHTIDSLIIRLRDRGWLERNNGAYFFTNEKNDDIDIVHALKEWRTQWQHIGRHADIVYDDTALNKVIAKLENGSPIFDGDIDALEVLVDVQRKLYQTVPDAAIQHALDDFNALQDAVKRLAA